MIDPDRSYPELFIVHRACVIQDVGLGVGSGLGLATNTVVSLPVSI
jgi:hypothetical protein